MINIEAKNLADGWLRVNKTLVSLPNTVKPDWNTTKREYYLHLYNVVMTCQSSRAPGLYLEAIGYAYGGGKIKHLISHYLDLDSMRTWLAEITRWQHRDTPYFMAAKESGKEFPGSCLIGFSFRLTPEPHLLMLSRAVEMPHKGAADALLCSAIAQCLEDRLKLSVPLQCTWIMDTAWVTSRTARLFLIYQYPHLVRYHNNLFQKGMQEGWEKYFLKGEKLTYSSGRKMQEFFSEKQAMHIPTKLGDEFFHQRLEEELNG